MFEKYENIAISVPLRKFFKNLMHFHFFILNFKSLKKKSALVFSILGKGLIYTHLQIFWNWKHHLVQMVYKIWEHSFISAPETNFKNWLQSIFLNFKSLRKQSAFSFVNFALGAEMQQIFLPRSRLLSQNTFIHQYLVKIDSY